MKQDKYLEYIRVKHDKKMLKEVYTARLIELKRELHNEYKQNNRWKLRLLDIIFVLSIILNIGAMAITNAMVVKEKPDTQLHEINPIQAEVNDYVAYGEAKPIYFGIVFNLIIWGVMLSYYLYYRSFVFNQLGYVLLSGLVITWFMFMAFDFFNDFGYWIGRVIYG